MNDKASVITRLSFSGADLDPARLTALIGREPTDSFRKGELRGIEARAATEGRWMVSSERAQALDAQIVALFSGATEDLATWRELVNRHQGLLEIVVRAPALNDAVFITPESVRAIADRGLTVAIDLWNEHADRHWPA